MDAALATAAAECGTDEAAVRAAARAVPITPEIIQVQAFHETHAAAAAQLIVCTDVQHRLSKDVWERWFVSVMRTGQVISRRAGERQKHRLGADIRGLLVEVLQEPARW